MTSAGARSEPPSVRTWPLLVGVVFAMMGLTLVTPIVPLYGREFGVSRTAAGALVSAFALARLFFDLTGGRNIDRIGPKRVMTGGGLLIAVAAVGSALAPSYPVLVLSRVVEGVGSAAFATAAQARLVKQTEPGRLGRAMAAYQTGLLVGTAVGPALGGFAADLGDFTTPFWVYAALGLVIAALSFFGLDEPQVVVAGRSYDEAGRDRRRVVTAGFAGVMFIGFVLFVVRLGARSALLPLFAAEELGIGESGIGLVIAASAIVNLAMVVPAGRASDRWDRRYVTSAGLAATGIAVAAYGYADGMPALVAVSLFYGLGSSFSSVAVLALAGALAPPGREGLAIARYRAAGDAGAVVGPVMLGAIAEHGAFRQGFWVTALLLAVAAVVAVAVRDAADRPG